MTHHRSSHAHHHAEKNTHFKASTSLPHVLLGMGAVLLSSLTLTACSLNVPGMSAQKAASTTEAAELAATTRETVLTKNLKAYKPVLDEFAQASQSNFANVEPGTERNINALAFALFNGSYAWGGVDKDSCTLKYAFHDFDEDGIDELVIGMVNEDAYRMVCMYQLIDGKPLSVFDEGDFVIRQIRRLEPDNTFLTFLPINYQYYVMKKETLRDHQLVTDVYASYDEDGYHATNSDDTDPKVVLDRLYAVMGDADGTKQLNLEWEDFSNYKLADRANNSNGDYQELSKGAGAQQTNPQVDDTPLELNETYASVIKEFQKAEEIGWEKYSAESKSRTFRNIHHVFEGHNSSVQATDFETDIPAYTLFDMDSDGSDELVVALKSQGNNYKVLAIYRDDQDVFARYDYLIYKSYLSPDKYLYIEWSKPGETIYEMEKMYLDRFSPEVKAANYSGTYFAEGTKWDDNPELGFNKMQEAFTALEDGGQAILDWHRVSTFED